MPTYFLVPPLCGRASGIAGESDTGDLSDMSFYSGCHRIKLETPERVIPVETKKKSNLQVCKPPGNFMYSSR